MSRTTVVLSTAAGFVAGGVAGGFAGKALEKHAGRGALSQDEALLGGATVGALLGASVFAALAVSPEKTPGTIGELPMTTPAQASGQPNFVTDVPVQGPTDQGIRSADCRYVQDRIPTRPACVDCEGPIPMWAKQSLSTGGRANYSGIGERVSFGGVGALGFALAGDEIWTKLMAAQQTWVMNTLVKLNDLIVKSTGTSCSSWGPSITAAGGCFQNWFNGAKLGLTKPDGSPVMLRTDGVFDQDTLDALRTVAALNAKDFPTPFPGTEMPGTTTSSDKKLSTGAMAGIAAAGATVLGGIIYAATRGGKARRRR